VRALLALANVLQLVSTPLKMINDELNNLFSSQLYLTSNVTDQTAAGWAQEEWFPAIFSNLVVAMSVQFIVAYEHVLHIPMEWSIWSRILRRKKLTRAILPWSTLWLRYTTLTMGILGT
jgi:hypothetical protein